GIPCRVEFVGCCAGAEGNHPSAAHVLVAAFGRWPLCALDARRAAWLQGIVTFARQRHPMGGRPAPMKRTDKPMEALQHSAPRPSTLADGEVIARIARGEKGLYEILMRRYNQTLYRAVRSYLHRPADVEDAM